MKKNYIINKEKEVAKFLAQCKRATKRCRHPLLKEYDKRMKKYYESLTNCIMALYFKLYGDDPVKLQNFYKYISYINRLKHFDFCYIEPRGFYYFLFDRKFLYISRDFFHNLFGKKYRKIKNHSYFLSYFYILERLEHFGLVGRVESRGFILKNSSSFVKTYPKGFFANE